MVSLWFKHDTGLLLMIEILKMIRGELDKTQFRVNGERVRTNLEMSPQKKRAYAMFFEGIKEAQEDETKIKTILLESSDFFLC